MGTNKKVIRLYWEQIRKDKLRFFAMALLLPLGVILWQTVFAYLISQAVGKVADGNTNEALAMLFWAGAAVFTGIAMNLVGIQCAVWHEAKTRANIINSTMDRLLLKDYSFFINEKVGSLTSKFIDFVNAHIGLQDLVILRTIPFILTSTLGITLISLASPLLGLMVGALIVYILLQVKLQMKLRTPYKTARKKLAAETNGVAADIISNNISVKTFGQEKFEIRHIGKYSEDYRKAHVTDLKILGMEGSLRLFITASVQIIAVAVMIHLISKGQLDIGIAVFTIAYLQRFVGQIFELGELINGYDKIFLMAGPMADIMYGDVDIVDKPHAKKLSVNGGNVTFSDVFYQYPDSRKGNVIDNLSLDIKAGQHVGLIGRSGAGKTTVTHLLLRFSDITQGSIEIDGQDIRDITQESLRHNIAYVAQEPVLFHRTLRENIAYGRPNATDEEIYDSAKKAHAIEFIENMPQGFDTIVGERGVKLSGGQRQRIAIARAILKDAPILVLDEATSALDSESEKLIQDSLTELMKGRTSIVIAHRLSTIAKLDRIIVLDNGKVAEDGTHEKLLKQKGIYAKLWSHQSGGFIEE